MGAPRFFRGRTFLVETSKVEQVTVVSEDGRPRNLGTQDTEGLMFYAREEGRRIMPSIPTAYPMLGTSISVMP